MENNRSRNRCAFYNDLYKPDTPDVAIVLRKLLLARRYLAYGATKNYLVNRNCVAWVRAGDEKHNPGGCIVVLNNGTK